MPHLCLIIGVVADTARRLLHELPPLGFRPYVADSCHAATALLQQWRFDALLVDATVFGEHTGAALQTLHRHARTPIVLLAPAADEAAQLAWLESGASDIVGAPASTRLLAAKLRRLLEAHGAADDAPAELAVGPLWMHARRGAASVDGQPLTLTAHQFELLFMLATRLGEFIGRDAIARALRGSDGGRSADVHVYRIRKKLRELGVHGLRLDTVHGRGYCLSLDAPAPFEGGGVSDDFSGTGTLHAMNWAPPPAA